MGAWLCNFRLKFTASYISRSVDRNFCWDREEEGGRSGGGVGGYGGRGGCERASK